jgi:hypothetical protein
MSALQRDNIYDIPYYCSLNKIQVEKGLSYLDFKHLLNDLRIGKSEDSNKILFRILAGSGNEFLSCERLHHFIHDFYFECTYV